MELFGFNIGRKQRALIGVDIGASSVKMVVLSNSTNGYQLESYAIAPIMPGAIVDNAIVNINAVADAIKSAHKKMNSKVNQAAVSLPGSLSITKVLAVPSDLNDDEKSNFISVESSKFLPVLLKDVDFDFEVQGINEVDPEMVDVLFAASRKNVIESRVNALLLGGVITKIVDIESFALERAFGLLSKQDLYEKTVAIFNIGSETMTSCVIYRSVSLFSREQVFGGSQLTETVQRVSGLTYEAAELSKKNSELVADDIANAINGFKKTIAQQIQKSLQLFSSSGSARSIDLILLTGGCSAIVGLDNFIETTLDIPVLLANPFEKMSLANSISLKKLTADVPTLMIACGLALRGLNVVH